MNTQELVFGAASSISALIYLVMHVAFHWRVLRDRSATPAAHSNALHRVSILKPLAGDDDELAQNLSSFASLAHPNYELLLGVASRADAAWPIATRFVASNPGLRARVVLTDPNAASNPKVAQLLGLLAHATGEVVVISDANVRVPEDYLQHLCRTLALPNTGLVTSTIVGMGELGLGAALENLQMTAQIAPGVAALDTLTPTTISIGKSMAMRRVDLARIGGLESVADLLAEDHMLGVQFAKAGFKVRVCTQPVFNFNVHTPARRSIERHARWAKMRRCISPLSFYFEPLLVPVVVATLAILIAPSRTTALMFAACAFIQLLGSSLAIMRLRGSFHSIFIPLEIARTYIHFYTWLCAVLSLRVNWRGHPFVLGADSRLFSVPESSRGSRARRRTSVWAQIRRGRLSPRMGD